LAKRNTLATSVAGLTDKLRPHAGSARTAGVALRSILSALALAIAEAISPTLRSPLGASAPRVDVGRTRPALSVVAAGLVGGLARNAGSITRGVATEAIDAEVGLALSVAGTRSTIGSAIATLAVDALGGRLTIVVGGTGRRTGGAGAEVREAGGGTVVLAVASPVAGAGIGLEQGRSAGRGGTLDAHLGIAGTGAVAETAVRAERMLVTSKRLFTFIVRIGLRLDRFTDSALSLPFLRGRASLTEPCAS